MTALRWKVDFGGLRFRSQETVRASLGAHRGRKGGGEKARPGWVATVFLALVGGLTAARATASPAEDAGPEPARTLGDVSLSAEKLRQTGPGDYELVGAVSVVAGNARIQADRLSIREGRYVLAEGNVLVVWSGNRMTGTRMTYDLEGGRGVIENATGSVEPEFYFTAARAEKVGEDRVVLEHATVTTCTQPVPYWSFSVSKARIRLDHYAHMTHLRVRAKRVPLFYLPYMVWPVKRDRAAGLLFPTSGTTRNRGQVLTLPLFLPIGSSADITLFGEYYTKAGWGGGGELVVLPNRAGRLSLSGFYIQDRVAGFGRWRVTYKQTQDFLNGFRLVADINEVSDFAYFTDFERELRIASTPTTQGRIEMTRNGAWLSLNVRELRREQLFPSGASSVQQTLPEIELRGRSRRLGKTPFYFSFESSLDAIQQRAETFRADYRRMDLFPTLSLPVSLTPWLDVNTTASYRATHYTQRDSDPSPLGISVSNDGLTRRVGALGIELVGPKLFRYFSTGAGAEQRRFKHVWEPRVLYSYGERFARADEILKFDEIDLTSSSNQITYGFRTRLFAQRPRARPTPPRGEGEAVLLPEPSTGELRKAAPQSPAPAPQPPSGPAFREPVEIASIEIRQSRAFDRPLSTANLDSDAEFERTSPRSAVELIGRWNPNAATSFDLRTSYNILFDRFSNVSLSGHLHRNVARVGFSLVNSRLGSALERRSTQLRLFTGVSPFAGKLRLELDGTYVPTAPAGSAKVPDQRWRVEYYTQCCGFLAEYLARDFGSLTRREFRFSLDLRGIGRILDSHFGEER